TSKDEYLISTLRFVSVNESTQIYGAILLECLTSLAMKESKAYTTSLGYVTGVIPPTIAREFKKTSPSKKDNDLVPVDEEPVTKGKRVKSSVKKSSTKPAAGNDDENKSDDDKIPSDNEKDSDSKQDTDGSESDSESDQQEYEEEIKDDDDDDDNSEGDEGRGMDDTTNQFSDDVQDKKVDVEMP
nr:hypothetical protein [Tanacetum cinerariifolium]